MQANRRGASAIIVVMLFVVGILFAFLTLNMANIQRHQAASQIASDLGSQWGVDLVARETNLNRVERQVKDIVARNWTVNHRLAPGWLQKNKESIDIDVAFGSATSGSDGSIVFAKDQFPTNAVRVNSQSFVGVAGFASSERKELGISRTATSVTLERDICLVVDRSGSMNFDLNTGTWSQDRSYHSYNPISKERSRYWRARRHYWWWYWPHPSNSRWATMLPAIHGLADELEDTRQNELFSIVSYSTAYDQNAYTHGNGVRTKRYRSDAASVETDPSYDYATAADNLEHRFKWDQPVMGGTNISAGIDKAREVLTGPNARPHAFKTMIVMTDGQFNSGREPWLAAEDAMAEGIEVYTVTFSNQADQSSMRKTALLGGGRHFHAPDGDSLEEIFREIANIPPKAYIE